MNVSNITCGSSDFEPASSFLVPSRKHYKLLLLLLLFSGTLDIKIPLEMICALWPG